MPSPVMVLALVAVVGVLLVIVIIWWSFRLGRKVGELMGEDETEGDEESKGPWI